MISEMIKEIRKKNYLSQADFAKKIGVSQGSVSQWEHGITKPSFEQLKSISAAFDISIDVLLNEGSIKATTDDQRDPEAKILIEGIIQMPQKELKKALIILRTVFPEYFKE